MPTYSILDLVRLRSDIVLKELEGFQASFIGEPDLVVKATRGLRRSPRLSRRISVGNPSLSYVEHFGSLGATVSIDPGQPVEVDVNWLLKYSNAVLYVNIVEPLLRLLIARTGFALVHSACISRRDKAILVSAPPDTGKTTTVLRCLNKGWFSFLSDDMTILGPDGTVYTFPKPFTISAHTFSSIVEDDKKAKGFGKGVKLRIKSYVHSKTGRTILRLIGRLNTPILTLNAIGQLVVRPPKIFVEELVKGVTVQPKSQAGAVCLLRKGSEGIVPAVPEEALRDLLANSEEAFGFPPYSDIFRTLKVQGIQTERLLDQERKLLERLVESVPCYWLYSDSRKWDMQLNEIMDKLVQPIQGLTLIEATSPSALPKLEAEPLLGQP